MKAFPSIRIEGGLFAPDLFDQLLNEELPGQKPRDFGLEGRRGLTDEIAAVFTDAQALWRVFQHRVERLPEHEPGTSVTRDAWVIPFLGLLDFDLHFNRKAYVVGGLTFAVSHRAGEDEDAPPVHVVGVRQELGRVAPSGRPRLAPHSLVQEFLNRTEALWGLVTNGKILRLLRDSTYIRRQCYVEFNLEAIFEQHLFQDFAVLFRLLHRTRFPRSGKDIHQCFLEQYYQHSVEQGGRVREHLRVGVEECIKILANGFLRHPANSGLRGQIQEQAASSEWRMANRGDDEQVPLATHHSPITAHQLYHHLLRLVYRFLFLFVSEDRGLISQNPLYLEHYSISRLRKMLDNRSAYSEHEDIWHALRVLWKLLSDDTPVPQIGGRPLGALLDLPVLNGELFEPLFLDDCLITNRDLLEGIWHLVNYREKPGDPPRRVNYAALDVEELGSVYESLLEYHPGLTEGAPGTDRFELIQAGEERRSTGSHYTPTELVNPLIEHALEPVLQEKLTAASTPEEKKTAILSIKVLDPACGSGHFLLAAARRLGKEYARIETGEEEPAPERIREATRQVIAHCIYGVDKNPLAVELCKVALWLESHDVGKPLTFLDHHIRCGDSLVGVTDMEGLNRGIPDEAYKPLSGDDRKVASLAKRLNATERKDALFAGSVQKQLEKFAQTLTVIENMPDDSVAQVNAKAAAFQRWQKSKEFRQLHLACDLWVAAFFQKYPNAQAPAITTHILREAFLAGDLRDGRLSAFLLPLLSERRLFHWPLEFPEIFFPLRRGTEGDVEGGFHVILGNPPFMGGWRIGSSIGLNYRKWLENLFSPFEGMADLCAAFFRQAFRLLKPNGRLGMIATNTLGQGDTRESGLAAILKQGGAITFARRFVKWPGQANVEVNLVAISKPNLPSPPGRRAGGEGAILDDQPVDFISSRLDDMPKDEPKKINLNKNKVFMGDKVRGSGFIIDEHKKCTLINKNIKNSECIYPFLNGEELNHSPTQQPSRWIICFHDWDLTKARDFPDLLELLKKRVKPEREKLKRKSDVRLAKNWWQFEGYRIGMRKKIKSLKRILVRAITSELHMISFVPKNYIFSHALAIFAFDDDYHFALLQSNIHEAWVRKQASSLRTDIRYTPTDCFETFPFPPEEYRRMATPTPSGQDGEWRIEELPGLFRLAEHIGSEYHEHRRQIMLARQLGLTKTYNLFHDPACTDSDIARLRELHVQMDNTILACYGWEDVNLHHGFYENERGKTRYTISPESRRELLRRLVALNLELAEK
ncbi:MAG: hypothetical protein Kow0042_13200 [Calditrichia bacterium]